MRGSTSFTYSEILKQEFETRRRKNPSYSLRAFSRDIGMSPASGALLIRGKLGLSKKRAGEIARCLGYQSEETQFFCDLVVFQSGRTAEVRRKAKVRLTQYDTRFNTVEIDQFRVIADWYCLAILELVRMFGRKANEDFIVKRLGVSKQECKDALSRLTRLGLLTEAGASDQFISLPDGPADKAVQKFHQDLLQKARIAVTEKDNSERNVAATVIRMRKKDLEWASQQMRRFRRKLATRLEEGDEHDSVYALSMQLFPLG